jgi:DNA-binding winged helix-turn-helix (wHTH) protein/tetratricopeptide (TPR) repeat protein
MSGASYRFGPFLLDRAGYRVLRGQDPVDLTPKLLDLLIHLIDHAGALVTKEQLLDALWPGANVTENALAQAMSELRDTLGDDPGSPQFIKTIARRGYRFIGAVETVEVRSNADTATVRLKPDTGMVLLKADAPDDAESVGTPGDAIAVMDFVNVTGDPESAWLSAGIAETVTGDLRALGLLRVVDRWRVVEAMRATDGSLQQVVQALGARFAVVGSVQRSAARIRITARVVDVQSGDALADAKVDGPIDEIFDLQDQVVAQFSEELGLASGPATISRGRARDTPSLDAYRAFTEGSLRLESLDVRQIPQAIADFERAVATDGRYALAYAGLASAELASYETSRSDNEPAIERLQRAVEHARHAVALDDSLAEAHATLALVLVSAGQSAEAGAAARRAAASEPSNWRHLFRLGHATWGDQRLRAASNMLALYPDFAFAHFQMAMVHVARGRLTDAETVLRQGAAVQDRQIGRGGRYPALGLHWLLALVRLALDDVDEALIEFDRETKLAEPHRLYGREFAMYAWYGRGEALLRAKRAGDAIDSFQQALVLYSDHARTHLGLSLAFSARGRPGEAAASFRHAETALAVVERTRPLEGALIRTQILTTEGRLSDAVRTLDTLVEGAPPGFAGWTLPVEPFVKQLADTKGITAVLDRLADRAK